MCMLGKQVRRDCAIGSGAAAEGPDKLQPSCLLKPQTVSSISSYSEQHVTQTSSY
jgi:hypothetical protein